MARGAALRRTTRVGETWFSLIWRRNDDFERVHGRAANTLIRLALVEKVDDIDWRIAAAGRAWLAANNKTPE
jgi:hypothetical protein